MVAQSQRSAEERVAARLAEVESRTPNAERFEIVDCKDIGEHLVMKVKYPNCQRCAYEGTKILVYLKCTVIDAIKWRKIDPHFREPLTPFLVKEAPPPAARFPASAHGWEDALEYARRKGVISR
jgi:hypothetical protein